MTINTYRMHALQAGIARSLSVEPEGVGIIGVPAIVGVRTDPARAVEGGGERVRVIDGRAA